MAIILISGFLVLKYEEENCGYVSMLRLKEFHKVNITYTMSDIYQT